MAKRRRQRDRKQHEHHEGSRGLSTPYRTVIGEGRQLAEMWEGNWKRLNERQRLIHEYYARPEIQRAMFTYASGRKISVLRTFRPLYNRIETPEDILYIALYHAEQKGMWPSLHGMISRHIEESNQHVCDFVVEVDKMNWRACFEATLPYIELLRDFGIYARIKFSGHVSAHVMIPGETFSSPADTGNLRKQFSAIATERELLMNYVQKIVKRSDKLDRYFLRSSHFLRLAYSMNERTGLVSVPIEMEKFEKFSWRDAEARRVQVLEEWWKPTPEDAQDRMREFVAFISRNYHILQKAEATEQREKAKQCAVLEAKKRGRGDKLAREGRESPVAVRHATHPLVHAEDYQQMLSTAQEEKAWCEVFLACDGLSESLSQLQGAGSVTSLQDLATRHGGSLNELWRAWHWLHHLPALVHYSQSEVQRHIFQTSQRRRLRLWSEEGQFQLQRPEDVYLLAVFHHKLLGTHEYPAFLMSVARYEPDTRFPSGYDLMIDVDGHGQETVAAEVAAELGKALSSQNLEFIAYHAGMPHIYFWIQTPQVDEMQVERNEIPNMESAEMSQRYATITDGIHESMRHTRFPQVHWRVLKSDEFVPMPHSLNAYTGVACHLIEGMPFNLSQTMGKPTSSRSCNASVLGNNAAS
ncbi:MAG: hypothetical protein O7E52_12360 [Candidatus Poribacteria bacterium]|nr:hypothetical protein [Candidatus Poribacteria bacterium]